MGPKDGTGALNLSGYLIWFSARKVAKRGHSWQSWFGVIILLVMLQCGIKNRLKEGSGLQFWEKTSINGSNP